MEITDAPFSVSGTPLAGKVFTAAQKPDKAPAVLFIHGWTSRQDGYEEIAGVLADQGFVAMTFDLRGHGASGRDIEKLTRKDFLDDAIAAYDFLASVEGVDASRITVIGSSFGSYITALLSSKRPCFALGLRVPADYPDESFEEPQYHVATSYYEGTIDAERQKWRSTVHAYTETMALRAVHDFLGRVLIVESEADDIVPHEVPQSYMDAVADKAKLTFKLMQGAPHSIRKFPKLQQEWQDTVLAWIGAA